VKGGTVWSWAFPSPLGEALGVQGGYTLTPGVVHSTDAVRLTINVGFLRVVLRIIAIERVSGRRITATVVPAVVSFYLRPGLAAAGGETTGSDACFESLDI